MKKKILLFALWLTSVATALAGSETLLIVTLRSGTTAGFALSAKPEVTFSGTDVRFATASETVSYAFGEVKDIKFGTGTVSGINEVTTNDADTSRPTTFTLRGNALGVQGLPSGSAVSVYGTDGRLATSATADEGGNARLELPASAGKTFIVKTSVTTFKIIKK